MSTQTGKLSAVLAILGASTLALAGCEAGPEGNEPGSMASAPAGPTIVTKRVAADGKEEIVKQTISYAQYKEMHARRGRIAKIETAQQALHVGSGGPGCVGHQCQDPNVICQDTDTWGYNMFDGWALPEDQVHALIIHCFRGQQLDELPRSMRMVSLWAGAHRGAFWDLATQPDGLGVMRRFEQKFTRYQQVGSLFNGAYEGHGHGTLYRSFLQQGSAPQPPLLTPGQPTPTANRLTAIMNVPVSTSTVSCGTATFWKDSEPGVSADGTLTVDGNNNPICSFSRFWLGVPNGFHQVQGLAFGLTWQASGTLDGAPLTLLLKP